MSRPKKPKYAINTLTLAAVILLSSLSSFSFAESYNQKYSLLDHPGGTVCYELTTSVTTSLYSYYQDKDHKMYSVSDLAKFVTPNAFQSIADDLLKIYNDDESFANGVLMIVHRIPYLESTPQKYPVETIVENEGDCDLLSFIAASIMKAGGLDVILLYYEELNHVNIGVCLSERPEHARFRISYFSYRDKRYYVAECTGDWEDWEEGWRVGESPEKFKAASAEIIPLENCEKTSPQQISSSLIKPNVSTIKLDLSSKFVIGEGPVSLTGSISPSYQNETVTIYVSSDGSSWDFLMNATTDSNGDYFCTWIAKSYPIHYVRSSWSGNEFHLGSDSRVLTLIVFPTYLLIGFFALILLSIFLTLNRTKKSEADETPKTKDTLHVNGF